MSYADKSIRVNGPRSLDGDGVKFRQKWVNEGRSLGGWGGGCGLMRVVRWRVDCLLVEVREVWGGSWGINEVGSLETKLA